MNKEILAALVAGASSSHLDDVRFDGDTLVIENPTLSTCTMYLIDSALKRAGVTYGGSFIFEYLPATKKAQLCIPDVKI